LAAGFYVCVPAEEELEEEEVFQAPSYWRRKEEEAKEFT
jgi:hypothetical protein